MRYLLLFALVVGCGVDAQTFGAGGYGGEKVRGTIDAGVGGAVGGAGGASGMGGSLAAAGGSSAGTGGATLVCASGRFWADADSNDGTHRPGSACAGCHSTFTLSGTVYATPDALTNCFGVDGTDRLSLQLMDAAHIGRGLKVNSAGNFWTTAPIVFPVTVGVSGPNGGVYMQGVAAHGDCNGCHTAAAGRVLPPA